MANTGPARALDDDEDASPIAEMPASAAPPAAKPARFGKRMMLIAGGVVFVVLLGAGAAVWLLRPAATAGKPGVEAAAAPEAGGAESFVDAPAMVVNLRGADGSARFLKIRFTFVPVNEAKGALIKDKLPLIVDAFQPFLRELRPEDLAGSAAVFRIKEEMLVRATGAIGPGVIKDILIQDLIQQ